MPTSSNRIDPSKQIRDEDFELFEITPEYRRYRLWVDRAAGTYIVKTEYLQDEELIALNQQEFNDSQGKRFGDGKVVGRIPLNKFYQELAPKIKEGDSDHARWWLNRPENQPYRNFRGKV